tara:strand:+ start:606 stop:788 length:183 start_codon:yes stop_codon:yes gene_type:complete
MRYCIARPINGISINGNEYVLNEKDGDVRVWDSRESCLEFIKENVNNDNPSDYLYEYEEK